MKQYDAIIIGFGKGGKTLAAELSNRGWKVAMIERSDKMYGGACINTGCVPTKALVHEATTAELLFLNDYKRQANFYKLAVGRKDKLISFLREKNLGNLTSHPNVTVYTGVASFLSPDAIKVVLPDEELTLQGKEIFINTGSTPLIPAIDGIRGSRHIFTSTTLLDREVLPRHLIVLGGGYIGLEFASMYASFGSKVTILDAGNKFMPRQDRDIACNVQDVFEKKGIEIRLNVRPQSIHDTPEGVTLAYTDATDGTPYYIDADAILLAIGRKPMIDGLNLQAAGVKVDAKGAITVDEHLHTTAPHIWAMGDVKDGESFAYLSLDDFRIIRDGLFGNKVRSIEDRNPVAYSVCIDPPLAHVGLTEDDAMKAGHSIKVFRLPATAIPRARILQQMNGMLKAIINVHTGRIMGCTFFCAEALELINTVNVAMKTGQHYSFLRDFIFTHPSMNEALNDLFTID